MSIRPKNRLKILHLFLSIHETSGPYNEHCLPMAKKRGITICTYFKSDFTPPEEITLFDGDSTLFGFLRTLKKARREKAYDIIHAHAPHAGVLFILVNLLLGKAMVGTVYTVQNSYHNYKFRNRLMLIPIFAFFRSLVLCSHACFESLPTLLKWLGRKKINIVQNAVDVDRVERAILVAENHQNGHFTIASVGRLIKIKNPFSLLKAFQHNLDTSSQLVFVGDGDLKAQLMQDANELGLENQVTATGLVGRDDVFRYLAKTDLFVSASYGEGLPVAVLEAMACGCPVILSDIPPHREIANGVDFIPLIRPNDVIGFAEAIKSFRQMPNTERKEIGRKCKKHVNTHYGVTAMHEKLAQIYNNASGDHIYRECF